MLEKVNREIMRVDEQDLNNRYKIGVLYCKAGQTTEEEWYNNGERDEGGREGGLGTIVLPRVKAEL